MVRLIMSGKGEGKTKQLMELMESAAENDNGCMVCIEASHSIGFSLRHKTRMIDAGEYQLTSFDALRGFLSGLYAGNYDISHIFIDNLCKVAHNNNEQDVDAFLNWLDSFANPINLKVTVTVSANPETATDTMRKYM